MGLVCIYGDDIGPYGNLNYYIFSYNIKDTILRKETCITEDKLKSRLELREDFCGRNKIEIFQLRLLLRLPPEFGFPFSADVFKFFTDFHSLFNEQALVVDCLKVQSQERFCV